MKVLLLGPPCTMIEDCIQASGDDLIRTEDRIAVGKSPVAESDFIVSYRYRHLIPADVLRQFGTRAVNLHISLLPWNRGADPNLWSYLEDTPRGVTIHVLAEGFDTGPILLQRTVDDRSGDTLASSYRRLSEEIEDLFCSAWSDLRIGAIVPKPQVGEGTEHRRGDKEAFLALLHAGWETPVGDIKGRALECDDAE